MSETPKHQSYGYGRSFNESMAEIRRLPKSERSVFGLRYEAQQARSAAMRQSAAADDARQSHRA